MKLKLRGFFEGYNIFTKILTIVVIIWGIVLSFIIQNVGILFFVFMLALAVAILNHNDKQIVFYFLLSFLVTSVFAVFFYYLQIHLTGDSSIGSDSRYYFKNIDDLVKNYRIEYLFTNNNIEASYRFFDIRIPQTGFIFIIATISKIFCGTANPIFYNIIVVSFSSLIVIATAKLAKVTTSNDKSIIKKSAYITMLYPIYILYSGVLLKETLTILIIVCIVYSLITIEKRTIAKSIALLLLFAFSLFIRYRIAIVLISLSVFVYVLPWNEKITFKTLGESLKNRWFVLIIFAIVSFILYRYCYSAGSEVSAALVSGIPDTDNPDTLSSVLKYANEEISQSASEVGNSFGFWNIIFKIPSGLRQIFVFFYITFHPFNFYSSFSATSDIIIRNVFFDLGTVFWLACIPYFVVGSVGTLRNKKYNNILLYFVVGLIAVMALVLYVSIRWKLMVWPFMGILIAIGIVNKKEYRKLWIVSVICTAFITLAYLGFQIFIG